MLKKKELISLNNVVHEVKCVEIISNSLLFYSNFTLLKRRIEYSIIEYIISFVNLIYIIWWMTTGCLKKKRLNGFSNK